MKKGFTLIELLVVVLIIGILAGVALPQYQRAVLKARSMRLLPLLKSISDAENIYYLSNNEYTMSFSALDIDLPAGAKTVSDSSLTYNDFTCFLRNGGNLQATASAYCNDTRDTAPMMEKYFSASYFICWGGRSNDAMQICKSVSGKSAPTHSSGGGTPTGFSF